jgi:hypothetical protein
MKELRVVFTTAADKGCRAQPADADGNKLGVEVPLTPFLTENDYENLRWYLPPFSVASPAVNCPRFPTACPPTFGSCWSPWYRQSDKPSVHDRVPSQGNPFHSSALPVIRRRRYAPQPKVGALRAYLVRLCTKTPSGRASRRRQKKGGSCP